MLPLSYEGHSTAAQGTEGVWFHRPGSAHDMVTTTISGKRTFQCSDAHIVKSLMVTRLHRHFHTLTALSSAFLLRTTRRNWRGAGHGAAQVRTKTHWLVVVASCHRHRHVPSPRVSSALAAATKMLSIAAATIVLPSLPPPPFPSLPPPPLRNHEAGLLPAPRVSVKPGQIPLRANATASALIAINLWRSCW